jgi:hypothetical protein
MMYGAVARVNDAGREHGQLLCRQALAQQHLLDEGYIRRLRLNLERLGFRLRHDAVLGERAG